MKKFYFDMDGVLADFMAVKNAVKKFDKKKGFFKKLKPIEKNVNVLKRLIALGHSVNIISASPNLQADSDKIEWLKKHIPEMALKNVVLCRNGQNKSDFVSNIKYTILIDDYTKNLIEWREKGGQVLKFVNDYDNIKGLHLDYKIPYTKDLNVLL